MIWRLTMVKFRERPSLALLLHSGQRQLRANTAGRFSTPSSLLLHISCKYFVNMPSKHRQCQHGSKYFCGVIIIFPVCVKSVPGVSNDEHDYEGMTMITLTQSVYDETFYLGFSVLLIHKQPIAFTLVIYEIEVHSNTFFFIELGS